MRKQGRLTCVGVDSRMVMRQTSRVMAAIRRGNLLPFETGSFDGSSRSELLPRFGQVIDIGLSVHAYQHNDDKARRRRSGDSTFVTDIRIQTFLAGCPRLSFLKPVTTVDLGFVFKFYDDGWTRMG